MYISFYRSRYIYIYVFENTCTLRFSSVTDSPRWGRPHLLRRLCMDLYVLLPLQLIWIALSWDSSLSLLWLGISDSPSLLWRGISGECDKKKHTWRGWKKIKKSRTWTSGKHRWLFWHFVEGSQCENKNKSIDVIIGAHNTSVIISFILQLGVSYSWLMFQTHYN